MKITISMLLFAYFCIITKSNLISKRSADGEDYLTRIGAIEDEICNDDNISLNFSNNVLENIGPNFIASPILTCLRLRGNRIKTISSKAFDMLPSLKYVDLSNNNWGEQQLLREGGHENMKEINLDNAFNNYNYHIMFIQGSYPSLENLYLTNNLIYELVGNSKANFSKLTNLDLSNNKIGSIKDFENNGLYTNDLSWLPESIKYLNLDNNALGSLYITNLDNLEILSVRNNQLGSISLKNLNKLKNFTVSGNRMERFSYSEFRDTPELEYLSLSDNKLTFFDGRIVDFTSSLHHLHLNKNLLTDAPEIKDAPNLQFYSLSCNQINMLEPSNFEGMENLQFLHLDNNGIATINADTFAGLGRLEVLSLGRNKLTNLPADWMITLKNLRILNLEHNLFTNVETVSFSNSDLLVSVYLQNNPLEYLRAHSLDATPENVTIHLDSNVAYVSLCEKKKV